MPGAVLHVDGEEFDPDSLLPSLSLRPYRVYRKGDPTGRRGQLHTSSGFCCDVSSVDGLLSAEAADALEFLSKHRADLARIREDPTVRDLRIDFGYYRRDVAVQCDYLSPELLRLAGELGIGFELSLYPTPEEQGDSPGALTAQPSGS